jgi:hypothetical protein
MQPLTPLIGEWSVDAVFPGAPPGPAPPARTTFEWLLDGRYVLQRAEIELAEAPDVLAVIRPDAASGGYVQHYFDSRGVVREYAMSFDGRAWSLRRDAPDVSPLHFRQRFTGTVEDDGRTIRGAWERTADDGAWRHDFELIYTKVG